MILIKRLRGKTLAIASIMCLMTGIATAQDLNKTGVVRISDMQAAPASQAILPTNCDQIFNNPGCADSCVPVNLGSCVPGNRTGLFGGCMNDLGNNNGQCYGCRNGNCQSGNCPNCQNGTCKNGNCPNCKNGNCRNGNCPNCRGRNSRGGYAYEYPGYGCDNKYPVLHWLGFCGTGAGYQPGCNNCNSNNGCLSQSAKRLLAWIDPCSTTCSYSPMHGFTPPSKRPYFRQPISYQHNYPANWVGGTPSGHHGHRPVIYTPTDTTQLGYYYQKVPTWVPVPGMTPPAPQPAEWHYYGSTEAVYAPVQGTPAKDAEQNAEAEAGVEVAPIPPMPEEKVEVLNLERTASSPRLLPILDTTN
jgi:hypothetical protein